MSHLMTALAMRQNGLKPPTKIVLYWLADHHNETTKECFPRIARLAELCEMSRRSVEGHISTLEEMGLIERVNRYREQGGKTSNGYILLLDESNTQNLRMGCAKSAHGDTQNLRMNNLGRSNLVKEQEKNTKKDLFPEFYEFYPKKKARGAAEAAWKKAIKKTEPEIILSAAQEFAKFSEDKDKQFIPYPATWLNQERWGDELEPETKQKTTTDILNGLFTGGLMGIAKQ